MFRISEAQIAVLAEDADRRFFVRVEQYLQANHAAAIEGIPDEELRSRITSGVKRGRRYRLVEESSLICFVALMFEISPNFDDQPNIHALLKDETVPSVHRIDAMLEATSEDDWIEAKQRSDPAAWEAP